MSSSSKSNPRFYNARPIPETPDYRGMRGMFATPRVKANTQTPKYEGMREMFATPRPEGQTPKYGGMSMFATPRPKSNSQALVEYGAMSRPKSNSQSLVEYGAMSRPKSISQALVEYQEPSRSFMRSMPKLKGVIVEEIDSVIPIKRKKSGARVMFKKLKDDFEYVVSKLKKTSRRKSSKKSSRRRKSSKKSSRRKSSKKTSRRKMKVYKFSKKRGRRVSVCGKYASPTVCNSKLDCYFSVSKNRCRPRKGKMIKQGPELPGFYK